MRIPPRTLGGPSIARVRRANRRARREHAAGRGAKGLVALGKKLYNAPLAEVPASMR